jgi:hypothetical protein
MPASNRAFRWDEQQRRHDEKQEQHPAECLYNQDPHFAPLVVVNVYRHTIARIRDYLKHGIDTLCLLGRGADLETLARASFPAIH